MGDGGRNQILPKGLELCQRIIRDESLRQDKFHQRDYQRAIYKAGDICNGAGDKKKALEWYEQAADSYYFENQKKAKEMADEISDTNSNKQQQKGICRKSLKNTKKLCDICLKKFSKSLAFPRIFRYNSKCCDMIAVKREVAAYVAGFPWSECQVRKLATSHCTKNSPRQKYGIKVEELCGIF